MAAHRIVSGLFITGALTLAMALAACGEESGIVYLECSVPKKSGGVNDYRLTVDESQGTVAMAVNSFQRVTDGIFTPDEVLFDKGSKVLSRVDLTLRTANTGTMGPCKKVKAPKRQF